MATSHALYVSVVSSSAGQRDQVGSVHEPFATIAGDGPTPFGSVPHSIEANEYAQVYDFERDGEFVLVLISADQDIIVWWQSGTPADGDGTKADLTWNSMNVPAGVPFIIPGSASRTNATAANHASDTSDEPTGASDSGEVAARIWLIGIEAGDDDAVATVTRRN